jgi:predicted nuclease of predicted toxin-antitoxin system
MSVGAATLKLYLDEDVDILLARLLSSRGFDCVTAVEAGQLGKLDSEHLEWATGQDRILITHNRVDFERLAVAWWDQGRAHSGIILAVRRADSYLLANRVLSVLVRYDRAGWQNLVLYA